MKERNVFHVCTDHEWFQLSDTHRTTQGSITGQRSNVPKEDTSQSGRMCPRALDIKEGSFQRGKPRENWLRYEICYKTPLTTPKHLGKGFVGGKGGRCKPGKFEFPPCDSFCLWRLVRSEGRCRQDTSKEQGQHPYRGMNAAVLSHLVGLSFRDLIPSQNK